jgi:transcriptional regulator with XRE-family HTH domain
MEAQQIVGWNVRRIRVKQAITIEELAGRADIDASFVARIERGTANPSIGIVGKLAKALKVSLADIVTEPARGERPPQPLKAGRRPSKLGKR